ncbi:MAG: GNAT family N-acetyltransferase [Acidobacteria bacterium]|nr:GNAT family N-acetyltransferase [Acidobacteriota bacterium]
MSRVLLQQEMMAETHFLPEADVAVTTDQLSKAEREEVLAFLAERPVHTVVMAGWIRDNGLVSSHNRGTFYGCRNSRGELEGVALIGHVTLLEVRTDRALEAFAGIAQDFSGTHLLMGEQERIQAFWGSYSGEGQPIRRACRETLFELQLPVTGKGHEQGLRPATMSDLHLVVPAQAQMAFDESGIDPRVTDPKGFNMRCARRIEQGRIWLLLEKGQLIFKADLIGETPEVCYLEGVYVAPHARGRGLGTRCMAQLSNHLLARAQSVCLLVNEQNKEAHDFYRNVGFQARATYDTVFLRRKQAAAPSVESQEPDTSTHARRLTDKDKIEVLEFLSARPAQTLIMAGWIHERGVERAHHGGSFYGYWNSRGTLEGVALIGRNTLFETRSDAAVKAFAEVARQLPSVKVLIGESERLKQFWDCYRSEGQTARLTCQEVLYECDRPVGTVVDAGAFGRATLRDLDQVVTAHAEMVLEESGVDPLASDPEGFRDRCARRIEEGKVWVLIKDGDVIFKADLVTETPKSAYLEGLWVNPAHRREGYGSRSLAHLSRALLAQKSSFTGFVDAQNLRAQSFYEKAGFTVRGRFCKIYL